jgi:hypothetical protein
LGLAVLAVLALAAHSSVHTACKTSSASFLATSVLIPLLVGSCRLLAGYLQTQVRPRAVDNTHWEAGDAVLYDHDDGRQEVVTVLRRHHDLLLGDVCTMMLFSLDWELQTAGSRLSEWKVDGPTAVKKRNAVDGNAAGGAAEWQSGEIAMYEHGASGQREAVKVLQRHHDLRTEQDGDVHTIFVPSLQRERQTVDGKLRRQGSRCGAA